MNSPGRKNPAFPWHLLALDLVGAALVAWGAYKFIGGEGGTTYIIIGLLLMVPFALHIINRAQGHGHKASRSGEATHSGEKR